MQDFKHRVALVTGASTGIGEAIAAELFRRGAAVRCICWSTTPGSPARTRWTSFGTRSKTGMR